MPETMTDTKTKAHAPTRADHDALAAAKKAVDAELADTKKQLAAAKKNAALQQAAKEAALTRADKAEGKAKELQAALDAQPAATLHAAEDAVAGPRPDEPRWMYAADVGGGEGRVFDNLDAVEKAQKDRPDYWFNSPDDAEAAYAKAQTTDLPG